MSAIRLLPTVVFVFSISSASIASQSIELKHDPFSYLANQSLQTYEDTGAQVPAAINVQWNPELHATIVAGKSSMANIAGKIIRIGGKINGFTLIEVSRQTATFAKGEKQVILKMKPKPKKHKK